MFNPASRMCHAALKGEEPDFNDRPNGTLMDADASDWIYLKDVKGERGAYNCSIPPTPSTTTYTTSAAAKPRTTARYSTPSVT